LDVLPHDFIEGRGEMIAGSPPFPDPLNTKDLCSQDRWIKIVMSNGVAPIIQFFESILARSIPQVQVFDLSPESQSESIEVRAQIAWVRIPSIEFPIRHESIVAGYPQLGRCHSVYQVVGAFRVQLTAIPLELRGEENSIGVVDLLGCISATWASASDTPVRALELIEG